MTLKPIDLPPPPPRPPTINPPRERVLIPPPKIDALLPLLKNARLFDEDEQEQLLQSPLGKQLEKTVSQCNGYRANLRESREKARDSDNPEDKRSLQKDLWLYQSCLAMSVCPARMRNYQNCGMAFARSMSAQTSQDTAFCDAERKAVERCVGNFVSRAVRMADTRE